MIGSQKNGADRVTKEKALKSVKKADEEMDEKRAQAQTLFSGGFILLVLIVATFIFLIPSKTILELNADITQLSSLSSPQITNAQIGSFLKPQFSIFDNNPSGSYALTASLNSTNYTPIYKEFLHVGVGRNSFVLGDGKLSGIWSANISLYRFNQTQSRWENVYSVSGVVNFG